MRLNFGDKVTYNLGEETMTGVFLLDTEICTRHKRTKNCNENCIFCLIDGIVILQVNEDTGGYFILELKDGDYKIKKV